MESRLCCAIVGGRSVERDKGKAETDGGGGGDLVGVLYVCPGIVGGRIFPFVCNKSPRRRTLLEDFRESRPRLDLLHASPGLAQTFARANTHSGTFSLRSSSCPHPLVGRSIETRYKHFPQKHNIEQERCHFHVHIVTRRGSGERPQDKHLLSSQIHSPRRSSAVRLQCLSMICLPPYQTESNVAAGI